MEQHSLYGLIYEIRACPPDHTRITNATHARKLQSVRDDSSHAYNWRKSLYAALDRPLNPSFATAFGRDSIMAHSDGDNSHDSRDTSETEALLNEIWLTTPPSEGASVSNVGESMTSRFIPSWSAQNQQQQKEPLTNSSDETTELALDSLRNSTEVDNAQLRAQGHEAALERRFSPLAALGLGFRYT